MAGMLGAGVLFLSGCTEQSRTTSAVPPQPVTMACEQGVTPAQAIQAGEYVLTRMQFPIEKLDVEQGIIKTRPLPGAQVFEFWRSDNASLSSWEEANLQSIRKSVELCVRTEDSPNPHLCVECAVSVQRLSLPASEVASTSEAYRIHSRSTPILQRIEVTPQQRRGMAWIDLGPDRELAARILARVEQRLQHTN